MRLFVGLWPSLEIQRGLAVIHEVLRRSPARPALKLTPPEQWHVTLRFLGDVPDDRVPALGQELRGRLDGLRGFSLRLHQPGCFPNLDRPRVVWVGLGGDLPALANLQRLVAATVESFAAEPEDHPFHPHFTLARVRDAGRSERKALTSTIGHLALPAAAAWTVTSVRLVRSELRPEGACYSTVAEIPLATTS